MAVAGSLVLGLCLAAIAHPADAFVTPSLARASGAKISPNAAARLPSSTLHLARSTFAPGASYATTSVSRQNEGRALSMGVINVGVIGAGRCVHSYWRLMPLSREQTDGTYRRRGMFLRHVFRLMS